MASGSILVLGAGELGTFVLQSLAKHAARGKTKIFVLLRQSTIETSDNIKQQHVAGIRDLGVQLLAGDIESESTDQLAKKLQPFDTVIVCTGMYSPPGTQIKIAKATVSAKVKRYFPWQYGLDYDEVGRDSAQDLFTEQLEVRDILRGQQTTSWVIISTGIFTSFLFEDFFGVVSKDRTVVRALGDWSNKVTVTDAADIGRMVAEVVLVRQDISNEVVYIAGDTITYAELANVVEKTSITAVTRELWTVENLMSELAEDPHESIRKYRIVFAQGKGTSWEMYKTLNTEMSIPLLDVRSWLSKQRT